MSKQDIEDILSVMTAAEKKEILDSLVLTLLNDLSEVERKDLLRDAVSGQKESNRLTSMVEY